MNSEWQGVAIAWSSSLGGGARVYAFFFRRRPADPGDGVSWRRRAVHCRCPPA